VNFEKLKTRSQRPKKTPKNLSIIHPWRHVFAPCDDKGARKAIFSVIISQSLRVMTSVCTKCR